MDPRQKEFDAALRKLTPVFQRQLAAKDVRHDLYGRDQLTWNEYERIGVARTDGEAADELMKALRRRDSRVLDILVECLAEQQEANADLIHKIRNFFPEKPRPTPPPTNDPEPVTTYDDWPAPVATTPTSHPPIPPPPEEGTDVGRKDAYKMSSKPRGMALIINNRNFTCGMKERVGTNKDAENLFSLFNWLGLATMRKDNLTGKAITKEFEDLSRRDHSAYDCVVIALLTHGISGRLYSTDGDLVPIEELTKCFDGVNCPSLIGKPKVFIVQACRGGKFDYGVDSESTDGGDTAADDNEQSSQFDRVIEKALDADETDGGGYSREALPTEADFVLAYATVPGYVSWRNSEYGSWFIKAFVDTMRELASKEHFMDILTEVNRKVAYDFQSRGRNKQIPAPVTMLTRKLYFRPGGR
ncbi:Caspase-3 [Geodia barretti]|uniref:Caspase-3 n=1 Tax=Geodia barretti TaxID=519541 RepID=A0AA35T4F4_GEOBA|nr:Caspase-3 [Geodia barretti]